MSECETKSCWTSQTLTNNSFHFAMPMAQNEAECGACLFLKREDGSTWRCILFDEMVVTYMLKKHQYTAPILTYNKRVAKCLQAERSFADIYHPPRDRFISANNKNPEGPLYLRLVLHTRPCTGSIVLNNLLAKYAFYYPDRYYNVRRMSVQNHAHNINVAADINYCGPCKFVCEVEPHTANDKQIQGPYCLLFASQLEVEPYYLLRKRLPLCMTCASYAQNNNENEPTETKEHVVEAAQENKIVSSLDPRIAYSETPAVKAKQAEQAEATKPDTIITDEQITVTLTLNKQDVGHKYHVAALQAYLQAAKADNAQFTITAKELLKFLEVMRLCSKSKSSS